MTRWLSRDWWFPMVGPGNDRVVPWLGPARFLPIALLLGAAYAALTKDFVGDDAVAWSDGPFIAGFWVLMCYGIARKTARGPAAGCWP
jgi:hypothetical protein